MAIKNTNGCFDNGLRADVARNLIENKALLEEKGSIYIGAGTTQMVGGENIPMTEALNPPIDQGEGTYVLTCKIQNNTVAVSWEKQ